MIVSSTFTNSNSPLGVYLLALFLQNENRPVRIVNWKAFICGALSCIVLFGCANDNGELVTEEMVVPLAKFIGEPTAEYILNPKGFDEACIDKSPISVESLPYEVTSFKRIASGVSTIRLSPDGKHLLYRRFGSSDIYIYDVETNKLFETIKADAGVHFGNHLFDAEYSYFADQNSRYFYWFAELSVQGSKKTKTLLYSYDLLERKLSEEVFDLPFIGWGRSGLGNRYAVGPRDVLAKVCGDNYKNITNCAFAIKTPDSLELLETNITVIGDYQPEYSKMGALKISPTNKPGIFWLLTSIKGEEAYNPVCEKPPYLNTCRSVILCSGSINVTEKRVDITCNSEQLFKASMSSRAQNMDTLIFNYGHHPSSNWPLAVVSGDVGHIFKKGLCVEKGHREGGAVREVDSRENYVIIESRGRIFGYSHDLEDLQFVVNQAEGLIFHFETSDSGRVVSWVSQENLNAYIALIDRKK